MNNKFMAQGYVGMIAQAMANPVCSNREFKALPRATPLSMWWNKTRPKSDEAGRLKNVSLNLPCKVQFLAMLTLLRTIKDNRTKGQPKDQMRASISGAVVHRRPCATTSGNLMMVLFHLNVADFAHRFRDVGSTEFGCILRAAFSFVAKKRQSAVHEMNSTKRKQQTRKSYAKSNKRT